MSETIQNYRESHLRSVMKGLSWRIVATTTTITIAWVLIGDVSAALAIGGVEFFAKFFIYYAHERAWARIPPGAVRNWWARRGG